MKTSEYPTLINIFLLEAVIYEYSLHYSISIHISEKSDILQHYRIAEINPLSYEEIVVKLIKASQRRNLWKKLKINTPKTLLQWLCKYVKGSNV